MSKTVYEDNWPLFEKFLGYLRYLKIRRYIQEIPDAICADIGCGFNGRFIRSIAKKIKRGYGFDIRANEAQYGNVEVINNSDCGGRIPLDDESVDRVFMLAVIEHLEVGAEIVLESFRILRRGGKIVITTPTPFSKPILEFLSYKLHLISEESIREHQHYYTEEELREIVKANGCRCERYKKFQLGCNELIVGVKE